MLINRIFIDLKNGKSYQFRKKHKTKLDLIINDNEGFIQLFALKEDYDDSVLLFENCVSKIEKIKMFIN
jgi:hypothetical protein